MNKFRALLIETRAPFLSVTLVPVILGAAAAVRDGARFDPAMFAVVLLGFIFMHLGTNVLNDYFDDKNGTDRVNRGFIAPFTGGSRMIQNGILSPKEVLAEAVAFYAAGSLLLSYASWSRGPYLLLLLCVSLFAGVFYTAPPFKWAHRGLGEFFIFLGFGPVMATGAYYALAGNISAGAWALSVPVGLLAAAIVDINEFPDYEADLQTGKKNMVVRLGKKNGVIFYSATVIAAYIFTIAAAVTGIVPTFSVAALIGLVPSLAATGLLAKEYGNSLKLAPACGMTVVAHLAAGAALIAAQFLGK